MNDTLPTYTPSPRVLALLRKEKHLAPVEAPQQLLERVVRALFDIEARFDTPLAEMRRAAEEFAAYFVQGYLMLGGPTLYNAGRNKGSLTSCVVIPVDLNDKLSARRTITSYFKQNMGSGFDFSEYKDPVALLRWLNQISSEEAATGQYDRIIGNIGMLDVAHPRIWEFVDAKRQGKEFRYFNISINVTEAFMQKAEQAEQFTLLDGQAIDAADLLARIAENAWYNGEPGIVFLERMNADNPVVALSPYTSIPPCSEMGLAAGETCQFGYINLAKFVLGEKSGVIDYPTLGAVVTSLTRALDDAIEYSLAYFPTAQSVDLARLKRKIGIGVCGLADFLIANGIAYDSPEARALARDILSFLNFTSKWASVRLAEQRGACLAMDYPQENRYLSGNFLEDKYAGRPTRSVSAQDWIELADYIRQSGQLRNISTTALPPATISSFLETSPSIEPLFNIYEGDNDIRRSIKSFLAKTLSDVRLADAVLQEAIAADSFQNIFALPLTARQCLQTAKEISIDGHLQMVADLAGLQGVIDEAASKTVNLPNSATAEDIKTVFFSAHRLGLKNISVYRDKSRTHQPEKL
jgi:ribonucleoside-diphosphate reductase alpha chain